jgi:hypothetical protein
MLQWWDSQNIVGPGAELTFDRTKISSWLCKPPAGVPEGTPAYYLNNNVSPGQSQYWAQNIKTLEGFDQFLISNCQGSEGVWAGIYSPTGQSGLSVMAQKFIEGCIPRHNHVD